MTKIHLLMKKEDMVEEKMAEGKVVVVLDVLLATTTIVAALKDGAREVIPVLHSTEAFEIAQTFQQEDYILAGELDAKPIEGFVYPYPTLLKETISGKTLILSTTNGTVALRKSASATKVYIAALLNNPAIASALQSVTNDQTILIVCAGNSGETSLEDIYGAGHLIDCLIKEYTYEMTDAAKSALYVYRSQTETYEILLESYVGRLLERHHQQEDIQLAASKGITSVVPILKDGRVVIDSPHLTANK